MKKIKSIIASLMACAITAGGLGSISANALSATYTLCYPTGTKVLTGVDYTRGTRYNTYLRDARAIVINRYAENIYADTNTPSTLYFPDQRSKYGNIDFTARPNPNEPGQKIKTFHSTNGATVGTAKRAYTFNFYNQC